MEGERLSGCWDKRSMRKELFLCGEMGVGVVTFEEENRGFTS